MPRCLASAVAVFGIMKAGAAYVPIDPQTPIDSLRRLIDDCGIRHLITHDQHSEKLGLLRAGTHELSLLVGSSVQYDGSTRVRQWETLDQFPAGHAPDVSSSKQDLAYIIYTSGSTGRPKGIMHTHYSGLSYAKLSVETYDVRPEDRIGSHSPLHFDMSTFGYFSGPLAGATTILIPEAYTKLPASLSQLIESEQLTIWYSVPAVLIHLLVRGALEKRDLRSLRWVMFGGEPFSPKHLRALIKQWPHATFSNVYGPAEVNQCTYYHVPAPESHIEDDFEDEKPIPLGKVWEDTEGLVVDDLDQPVPQGEAGELLIHSTTMMQGYWARPDLNANAFCHPEVSGSSEKAFYRTGDLVRTQEDGNYLFLGRKDRQIKTRGHRVELDEVEAALAADPNVMEAAAFPVRDNQGSRLIEAAAILVPGSEALPEDLMEHLSRHLAPYALPVQIAILGKLPRTATGKVDRSRLERLAEQKPELASNRFIEDKIYD